MVHRNLALMAIGLVAILALPSAALAVSTSSSSSSSSASSSSSVSLGHSNVLGALALGAGGRSRIDRADVALLASTPFLAADPCLATVRIRASYSPFGSSYFGSYFGSSSSSSSRVQSSISTPRLTEALQVRLVRVMMDTNGTLTQDALDDAFARYRDRLVITPCEHPAARHVSEILMRPCIYNGRGCQIALSARIHLDANGLDDTERALVAHALRRW